MLRRLGRYLGASPFVDQCRRYINGAIRTILSPPTYFLPNMPVCIRPSVVLFLPMEEGYFFRLLYVSLGEEGFNN